MFGQGFEKGLKGDVTSELHTGWELIGSGDNEGVTSMRERARAGDESTSRLETGPGVEKGRTGLSI